MKRPALVLSALLLLPALPASAQELGGIPLRGQGATLAQIGQLRPGCPLSQTSVTFGLNQAHGGAAQAQQNLLTQSPSTCRPLVNTQVVAGINLGLGPGSQASQSVSAYGPRGLLATDTFTRGVNAAFGRSASAQQQLFNQTGR